MKRRSWLAVLLSIIVPGLGQLYNGQARKAVLFYLLVLATALASLLILVFLPLAPLNVALPVALFAGGYLYVLWDAGVTADRTREIRLRRYNRWYVYGAIVLICSFGLQPLMLRTARARLAEAFTISSGSMAPTLLRGDYLLVGKTGPRSAPPRRFSLAVFVPPGPPRGLFIKRIVGLPGDTLEMRDKVLYLDGGKVDEPYTLHDDSLDVFSPAMNWERQYLAEPADTAGYRPTRDSWGPLVVPPSSYFVLGDNRDESEDSRYFGLVPAVDVVGVPGHIYFSRVPGGGIRWSRIGQSVR